MPEHIGAASTWALIIGMAVSAFVLRASFIVPGSRVRLSPAVERVLRYAPAAALMAIIVPDLALGGGRLSISLGNPRLLGGLVAFAVAFTTRSIILTILAGLAVLTAVRLLAA